MAKDVMFPSRVLKKELEEAKEKLREMERELNSIKQNESEDKWKKTAVIYLYLLF